VLHRLLRELDAAALQLLVRALHVVRKEEQTRRRTLRDEREELLVSAGVEDGRPRLRPKLVVIEPTLRSPTVKQMSATGRSVVRRSDAARSRRRTRRYRCGDSPNSRRNSRLKCAGESRAALASAFTSSGSR